MDQSKRRIHSSTQRSDDHCNQGRTTTNLIFVKSQKKPVQCRRNIARADVLGTEWNNNKRTVTEVSTFRNSWLGASGIEGCIVRNLQFLSLYDDDFLKRKNFSTLYQVSWRSKNIFSFNGQNKYSTYRVRWRSCGLVGRLASLSVKCILPVVLHRVSNTIELSRVTVRGKSEAQALIAWTKLL